MKARLSQLLSLLIFLGGFEIASGQITAQYIADKCAQDASATSEQYYDYGEKLARTLSLLTPEALARVLGQSVAVNLPGTLNEHLQMAPVNFGAWSADLSPSAEQELDKVVEFLNENPTAKIIIEGHTENHSNRNQRLSEDRASSASDYLISQGVSEDRIETIGFGGTDPLIQRGEGNTEVNRRIEIKVQ